MLFRTELKSRIVDGYSMSYFVRTYNVYTKWLKAQYGWNGSYGTNTGTTV